MARRYRERDFNPPSPCGEGHLWAEMFAEDDVFQSTLPVWGGTLVLGVGQLARCISIHPPRVGRDGGVAICQMI